MKDVFFIQDTTENRISYWLLLLFAVTLPYDRLYSELALAVFGIHTLIHLRKNRVGKFPWKKILVCIAIYLLTVIGTLYANAAFSGEAFYEWERQLSILLFPLLFAVSGLDLAKYKLPLVKGMALSCTLAIVFLYFNAVQVIRYNHLPATSLFTTAFINHNFSEPIDMHATYFSMYIALSITGIIYALIHTSRILTRLLFGCMLLVLFAGLIQLSSRSVFIAVLVIMNIVVPFLMLGGQARKNFLIISLGISVIVILALVQNDVFKNRYVTELKNDLTQQSINLNILEPRAVRWRCGWELIKQSPVWGHGSGSEVALLKEQYYQNKYFNSYVNELNIHNQFLSMIIKTGMIGLLILLFVLFAGFRTAIKQRDALFAGFMVIITIVFFSENVLDGNKGIFFFAFFYPLFYLADSQSKGPAIQK